MTRIVQFRPGVRATMAVRLQDVSTSAQEGERCESAYAFVGWSTWIGPPVP